jgi:hypothetical protein
VIREREPALRRFVPARQPAAAAAAASVLARSGDVYAGALPRAQRAGGRGAVPDGCTVWAELNDQAALERLAAFEPQPAIATRSGTPGHLHAYRLLDRPGQGWFCCGCGRGGTVFDFAAELWGLATRGEQFVLLRARLRAELLGDSRPPAAAGAGEREGPKKAWPLVIPGFSLRSRRAGSPGCSHPEGAGPVSSTSPHRRRNPARTQPVLATVCA